MTGKTISHYKILEKLGEGGMGVVYKAFDTRLERTVALKFLPQRLTASEEDRQRFNREAKAAAALNHPHICTIYSVDEFEGTQFISMEYLDGITLREMLETNARESETPGSNHRHQDVAINHAIQIAEALSEAHDKGIVHRDIKPENIMVDSNNRIKVMDFGLAKLKGSGNLTKSGSTLGTMAYMSPEQIQGKSVDHRSDLFALGVVLFEMLTGHTPFRGEHEAAMMYLIVNELHEPLTRYIPDAPSDLIHLIDRLLEKDVQDRYQNTAEVLGELKRIQKKSSGKITAKSMPGLVSEDADYSSKTGRSSSITISIPPIRNKATIIFSISFLLITIASVAWLFMSPGESVTADRSSIAVLPFENLSPNPDDAFFTDGVHDDIITQLSKIRDMKIIARSSVLEYPVGSRNYRQIQQELGVRTVMEGSVRRSGNMVRVSVQLIDLENMQTLWAEIFERDLTDIFAIQSEIGREISSSLRVNMTREEKEQLEKPLTENTEAYDMYLKALEYWGRPGYEKQDWDIVIDFLEKAVELDPEFVTAIARLSGINANYYWFGFDQTPQRLETAKRYADRAYELDPDSEFTNRALGNYYYRLREYTRALYYLEKTSAYDLIAYVQRRISMWDESEKNFLKAIERNPRNHDPIYQLALSYYSLRNYEKAAEYINRAIAIAPDFTEAKEILAYIHVPWKGDQRPLRDFLSQHPSSSPYYYFLLRDFEGMLQFVEKSGEEIFKSQYHVTPKQYISGLAYTHLGDSLIAKNHFEMALQVLEEKLNQQPDDYRIKAKLGYIHAYLGNTDMAYRNAENVMQIMPLEKDALIGAGYIINAAEIYAIIGEVEKSVQLLEQALNIPSDINRNTLRIDPVWDSIREHESFRQLIDRAN